MDRNITFDYSKITQNKNRLTQFLIMTAIVSLAQINWIIFKKVIAQEVHFGWPLFGFGLLLVLINLSWLLIDSKPVLLINIGLIFFSFLTVFGFKLDYALPLALAYLLFLTGSFIAVKEREDRMKIQWFKIFKKSLPPILFGLALVLSSAFYFSPASSNVDFEINIPRKTFSFFAQPIVKMTQDRLEKGLIEESLLQGLILEEGNLTDQDLIEEMLYQMVHSQLNQKPQNEEFSHFLPLGLSIALFFALMTIGIPLMYLSILIAGLIFKILVKTKAIKINEITVIKEVIEI